MQSDYPPDAVAVVGMALRFAQDAKDVDKFWQIIYEGKCCASEIPADRFNIDTYYDPDPARLNSVKTRVAHLVDGDLACFDAPFFGISPAEAAAIDPQHRGLLETTYHALENAGIRIEEIAGTKTSVFVAANTSKDYDGILGADPERTSPYHAFGTGTALIANRISHAFDLQGPSLAFDSACSSSLTAFHFACQSIKAGESTLSIVGGSNVILTAENFFIPGSNAGFLSPEGLSRSFDSRANGYARAEGFAAVVLKPLSQALKDGDTIRAIVRATGINNDGRTTSLFAPSAEAQTRLIKEVYNNAGLDSSITGFVEAHGTGTKVGDPIEANAIGRAFDELRQGNPSATRIAIGATKANVGHLENASGLAALIKTICVLETGLIPPIAGLQDLNPAIDNKHYQLQFPRAVTSWPANGLRRASINNFGYGGANAHVVLDDALHYLEQHGLTGYHLTARVPTGSIPNPHPISNGLYMNGHIKGLSAAVESPQLLILSAGDEKGLARQTESLAVHLSQHKHILRQPHSARRLAFTLSQRRSRLGWRSFAVVDSGNLAASLLHEQMSKPVRSLSKSAIAFVFTGQGGIWPRMGQELLQYPVYRSSLEKADSNLRNLGCQWSVMAKLEKGDALELSRPILSQTICTAVQIALVDLLASLCISPKYVVGHSSGEISAAYAAGIIPSETALHLAYMRGRDAETAMNSTAAEASQGMMVVSASKQVCQQHIIDAKLEASVFVGCVNGPSITTVTGLRSALMILRNSLNQNSILSKLLAINCAYHSPFMECVAQAYLQSIKTCRFDDSWQGAKQDRPHVYSSVTGQRIDPRQMACRQYWVDNLLGQVEFCSAISSICTSLESLDHRTELIFVEVGPGALLRRPVSQIVAKQNISHRYVSCLRYNTSAQASLMTMAGELFTLGCNSDIVAINDLRPNPSGMSMLPGLPPYQFNHEKRYWFDSRLSDAKRFAARAKKDLLGVPDLDYMANSPAWRYVITTKESPWILDHKINDTVLYPASGFCAMAIEAIRSLHTDINFEGVRLRDVLCDVPLSIDPGAQNAEARIQLVSLATSQNRDYPWYEFRISGLKDGEWQSLCTGTVQLEPKQSQSTRNMACQTSKADHLGSSTQKRVTPIARRQFYEELREIGYEYGPSFQPLDLLNSWRQGNIACASAEVLPFSSELARSEDNGGHSYLIHPSTLDGVFQIILAACFQAGVDNVPLMVARGSKELWISGALLNGQNQFPLQVTCRQTVDGFRDKYFDIAVTSSLTSNPVIQLKRYRTTVVTRFSNILSQHESPPLVYTMKWRPESSFTSSAELESLWAQITSLEKSNLVAKEACQQAETMAIYFSKKALLKGSTRPLDPAQAYLRHWFDWMAQAMDNHEAVSKVSITESEACALISKSHEGQLDPITQFVVQVGLSIEGIATGEVDPLQLLFKDGLADRGYHFAMENEARKVAKYFDVLAHANPNLRILEVGAGTGAATKEIMKALTLTTHGKPAVTRFAEYMYTDISTSFFENARAKFVTQQHKMRFQALDISASPLEQGFEREWYDVVVAVSVLHATTGISAALKNIKTLLKPGGKLLVIEPCNLNLLYPSFSFGCLPSWWSSEESFRNSTPLISEERWDALSRESGFSGIELRSCDSEDVRWRSLTTMVFSATNPTADPILSTSGITLLVNSGREVNKPMVTALVEKLQVKGLGCNVVYPGKSDSDSKLFSDQFVVSLMDVEQDSLDNMQPEQFQSFKALLLNAKHVLCVTTGASLQCSHPERAKIEGIARSVCSERGEHCVTVLSLDLNTPVDKFAKDVSKLFIHLLDSKAINTDYQYIQHNNSLQVGRLVPQDYFSNALQKSDQSQGKRFVKLEEATKLAQLSLTTTSAGDFGGLCFQGENLLHASLTRDEVEIEIAAVGLNFRDVLIALGQMPEKHFGRDGAGVIRRLGPGARERGLKEGDNVLCCGTNCFSTWICCSAEDVFPIPDHISMDSAASLPSVFTAAHISLYKIARLQKGESILIHAAAGGVGQMAIQLAQVIGADVYATVGTDSKRQLLIDEYGITNERISSSRDCSFVNDILASTCGRGVDVVLNSLAGELLQASFDILAPFGRFVEIGKRDIENNMGLKMATFSKSVSFTALDLALPEAKSWVRESMGEMFGFMQRNPQLHVPLPLHILPASRAKDAFQMLSSGKITGKVVVNFTKDDVLQVLSATDRATWLSQTATYVVVGGLTGLGKGIVQWMLAAGIKSILILSRRGAQLNDHDTQELFEQARRLGTRVEAPPCDISDINSLKHILGQFQKDMLPIKGCIHGGMVLEDESFGKMTLDQFSKPLASKVAGSWHLHSLLPQDMDFFIMLSSVAGLYGIHGQANYAAGNTFQDALARFRTHQGYPKSLSINLGAVADIGYMTQNSDVAAGHLKSGYRFFGSKQLLRVLDAATDPSWAGPQSPEESQIVLGITEPDSFRRAGRDVPEWLHRPTFALLHEIGGGEPELTEKPTIITNSDPDASLLSEIQSAPSKEVTTSLVAQALLRKLSKTLDLPESEIDMTKAFYSIGVDSLMAVEVRFWFMRTLHQDVTVQIIQSRESMLGLCRKLGYTLWSAANSANGDDVDNNVNPQ